MHLRNPRQQLIGLRRIWKCRRLPDLRQCATRATLRRPHGRAHSLCPRAVDCYRCTNAVSGYLDPRPTPASISQAYVNYCTHFQERVRHAEAIERIARALANGYGIIDSAGLNSPRHRLASLPLCCSRGNAPSSKPADVICWGSYRKGPRSSMSVWQRRLPGLARGAGWTTLGVEPDPVAVELARSRGLDVHAGSIEVLAVRLKSSMSLR